MSSDRCPTCGTPKGQMPVPPEPPVGTWVRDRFGGTSFHQQGGGWGDPGTMPFGKWEAMWLARGPLVECGPWGRALSQPGPVGEGS
jgi:hypothetical protein